MSNKTEQPTPRRLRKAREEGDSPVSQALMQAVSFIAALVLAPTMIEVLVSRTTGLIDMALHQRTISDIAPLLGREVLWISAPVVAAAALAALVAGWVQTGGVIATKRLVPDLGKLNPITGLAQLVSLPRVLGVGRALVTAIVVGYLAWLILLGRAPDLAATVGNLGGGVGVAITLLKRLGWSAALVGLALAGVDVLATFHAWQRRLRMSKDEIRREHRESEGDPELRAARRRAHEEVLRGATIAAVKEATVLVINPTHLATALSYQEEVDEAPRVVAQGRGELAEHMIEAARAFGIPVVRDVPVAHALKDLEVGDEISEALYEAVAEVLRDAWEQAEMREP